MAADAGPPPPGPGAEPEPDWDDMVLVGTIARTHGLRGQVIVNPETDFVEERFRPGAELWIKVGARGERLVVESLRMQGGRPVVAFAGRETIESAESLAGHELRIPEGQLQPLEPGLYYHHQLVGCHVRTRDGAQVGTVTKVEGGVAGSLLVVDGPRGEVLIPLAAEICVELDIAAKRIVVEAPDGLLELNERSSRPAGPDRSRRQE